MTNNETPAGRMAREWPELDYREVRALLCENGPHGMRAITYRAEDAAGMAGAKCLPLRITSGQGRSCGQYGLLWSPAYWAALP